ncbi:hypothetical protein [Brumimicrobium oceani]|uniref:Uncharacterized protein n=1 Tax=Brumimicrobium oceani TaxID=2100725 RepID=A0A2U2X3B6_9FLAO|nr:hypothetical protein [Brumimicrobium oceani]PWH82244.1 hypothetical protein DIT68_14160 [Brumimicrobium oceani]
MDTILLYIGFSAILLYFIVKSLYSLRNNSKYTFTNKFKKHLDQDLSRSLNHVQQALDNAGFKNVKFYNAENWFKAQSRLNSSSFTEEIVIKVRGDNEMAIVFFKSVCPISTLVFNLGKNRRNFKKFETELEKLIE